MERKILHIDMDAFYASIEMRDNPEYLNKPLVIARNPKHTAGKGVVATANYVARKYGIHSAMSAQKALDKCPHAIFKTPDFAKYRRVSSQIHTIFHEYTDKIENVALDEAYLDITENKLGIKSAVEVACRIQREIYLKTKLTCSTGVSYNKFLAKLASDYSKPFGITVVTPDDVQDFLFNMPIKKFRGVGKKTLPKMYEEGIYYGIDLYNKKEIDLINKFGKIGHILYQRVRGIDMRLVEWKRERKSVGKERTFDQPLKTVEEVDSQLRLIATKPVDITTSRQIRGKTLVIKVRNNDFETVTKRTTLQDYIPNDVENIVFYGKQLFEEVQDTDIDVRLLGLTLTNLDTVNFENMSLPI